MNIKVTTKEQVICVSHKDGRDGKSAYQQAVEGGYTGTEKEFNCSLSLLADVAEGKKQIAEAINTKGGSASAESSFSKLADDIENLNDSFITYGVTADPKINWLEFICKDSVKTRINLLEIDDYSVTYITASRAFSNAINLSKVNFHNLEVIESSYTFSGCSSLNTFIAEKLNSIVDYAAGSSPFRDITLKNFICPSLTTTAVSALFFGHNYPIENIVVGRLTFVNLFNSNVFKLRNITIGQNTDIDIPFQLWTATNVITEGQSGIDELNSNLYNNLLTKLYDHSNDGQTRTLRLGWLAHVTQENIDYANSKGWTLTT